MSAPSFSALKKRSKNSLESLREKGAALNTKKVYKKDERFWEPTIDKEGNGSAIIRFLPSVDPEGDDFVRLWDHGFEGPTGLWYIENSRTSILPAYSQPDPVNEYLRPFWKGSEADVEYAKKHNRRLHFISNILVVRDPGNTDNEGKVFLYKYGNSIFKIMMDAAKEVKADDIDDEDRVPVSPFDPFDGGANFRLRIRNVNGQRNYLKSEFDRPSRIGTDAEVEAIWRKCHDLVPFVSE